MSAFSNFDNEFYNLSATRAAADNTAAGGMDPQQQPKKDFGVFDYATDIALGVPRGILGGLSDMADLATMPFGYDTPDYFGLMDKSQTVVGGITEGIANFMTGFVPGGLVVKGLSKLPAIAKLGGVVNSAIKAAEVAGETGKAVALSGAKTFLKGAVAGAVADFTAFGGHEERLSNLLKDHAGFSNAVTDFLAADPNDSELTGRFKNAIEGLGIGAATEGLFNAFRVYKAGFLTKAAGGDADKAMAHEMAQIRVEQRNQLKQSFNLTDEQADMTNLLVDRAGLDRRKLNVVAGDQAQAAFDKATGSALEQNGAVRLFRGESKVTHKNASTSGGTFWTTDEKTAAEFGKGGTVSSIDFKPENLLNAETWVEAKQKVGLPVSASMDDLITAAKEKGHDSISFSANGRQEFILLNPVQETPKGEVRGFASFADDGKAIIGGLKNPDVGTAVHEIAHVARRQLFDTSLPESARMGISDADIKVVSEWAGAAGGTWSRGAEEKFANGFMKYLRDGEAPQGLAGVFEKFSDWMRSLYRDIKGEGLNVEISPEVRDVFDKLVSRGPGFEKAVDGATSLAQVASRGTTGVAEGAASGAPGAPSVLLQTTPGSPGLGKPGGTPYVPYNVERVTSIDELNKLAKDMVEQEPLASTLDATTPETLAEAAKAGQESLEKLNALTGDPDTLSFQRILNTEGGSVYDIQRARRELMGLTRFISTALDRVNTLASKGGLSSPEEMYEFIVGKRNTEIAIQVAKERKREFARGLGQNRWTPAPEKGFSFIPPLPKAGEAAPSPAAMVPSPAAVTPSPAAVTPGAAAAVPSPAATNPLMDSATKLRVIEAEIEKHGGRDAVLIEMKRVAEAAKSGPEVASKIIRAGRKGNMLTEFWINSILSGPVTAAVNFTANTMTAIYLPVEKAVGASLRGDLDTATQSLKQLKYMMYQAKDSMRLGAAAFREDRNFLENIGTAEADQVGRAWSAQARGLDPNSMAGQAMNFMGTVVNLPSRFLSATDEVFKQLNYRSAYMVELEAEALKRFNGDHQAAAKWVTETFNRTIENGQMYAEGVVLKKAYAEAEKAIRAGTLSPNETDLFVGKFMADENNWDPKLGALSKMSLDKARYATFSTPLTDPNANALAQVSAGIQKVVNQHPMLRFALPFIRTPTNILTFALDRTFPANLHNVRNAFGEYGKALQSAEAGVRSEAMGRLAFGSAAAVTMATAAFNGTITGGGPKNKAEREAKMATGWQPYSIKVGNTYYSYRRMDPFASVLGIIADVVEGFQYGEKKHDQSLSQVVNTTVLALARNFTNKTYLTGITNISNALSNPEQFGPNLVNQYVGSMVPFSSFMSQTMSTVTDDPVLKEVRTMADAVRAKIPGLADGLTPRRNVLGEVVTRAEGLGPDAISPVLYSTIKNDQILKEFDQLGHGFTPPKEMRGALNLTQFKTTNGQEAYDRWLELHGQVQIGGKTLRDALLREINSRSYQRLSPDTTQEYDSPRIRQLREIVSKYREAAYKQLLRESPELDRASRLDFANKQALRMGRSAQELFDLANR